VTVKDELQARALFEERYGIALPPVARQIERRVIGGDWGANGYTTMAQADTLATSWACRLPIACSTSAPGGAGPACTWRPPAAAKWSSPTCPWKDCGRPPTAPRPRALPAGRAWWWPPPAGYRFGPAASTPSSTPTCCVDCAPSSPW
jgi:hypothetical protein